MKLHGLMKYYITRRCMKGKRKQEQPEARKLTKLAKLTRNNGMCALLYTH